MLGDQSRSPRQFILYLLLWSTTRGEPLVAPLPIFYLFNLFYAYFWYYDQCLYFQYYKNILSTTLLQLIIYYLEINFEVWQKLDNDLKWPNDSKIQKIYDIMRYQAKLEIHTIFLSCYYTHQYTLHSTYLLSWTTYSIYYIIIHIRNISMIQIITKLKNRALIINESLMSKILDRNLSAYKIIKLPVPIKLNSLTLAARVKETYFIGTKSMIM